MGGSSLGRAFTALVTGATVALTLGAPSAAHADDAVVVRGTAFPDARAHLAYVGCDQLLAPGQDTPQAYVGRGPGQPPAGARSLGYDLPGGTAIGSQHLVGSVVGNNIASIGVFAPQGTTGLAVVGYQAPADQGTSAMWFGVAPISAPAGQWTTVAATPRGYVWTRYDMATRTSLEPSTGQVVPVGEFVAAHGGDGPGLYALTFGCDGAPFSIDAMRIGRPGDVTTYDLEGLATSLSISGSSSLVAPGDQVTLRGALASTSTVPHPTVILERLVPGSTVWENIRVVPADGAGPVARLNPTQTAYYRWRFADRPLAEGSVSLPFLVSVFGSVPPIPNPTEPTPSPTEPPSELPTPTPTLPVPPTPSSTPSPSTPSSPSTPTPEATPDPVTPATSPSDEPTPTATETSPAAGMSATP